MVVYQKIQRELSQEARLSIHFKEAKKKDKRKQKKTAGRQEQYKRPIVE